MKTLIASTLGALLYLGSISHASAQAEPMLQDTLTIQIGQDKKVIILVKDKQALKTLQNYDLNQMVKDLNQKADSLDQQKTIVITDEEGTRYRIAYSIEIEEAEKDVEDSETEEEAEIAKEDDENHDDEDSDINIVFGKKDKHKKKEHKNYKYSRTRGAFLFDLGVNNYLSEGKFPQEVNAQHAVKSWGSWYVGINRAYTTQIAGPLALQWGGGVSWYNFKFEDPSTRITKTAEGLEFSQEPNSEVHAEKSKLTVSYINLQLVPMLDFGYRRKTVVADDGATRTSRWHTDRAFRIGLGGYAGYRLGSYTKYKFELENDDKKDRNRDSYYLNNLRYGVRMQLGYRGLDLFAQYDLNDLITENRGPQLNAFSFGIMF